MVISAFPPQSRITSIPVGVVLLLLLVYGVASLPGLVRHWGFSLEAVGVLAGWIALAALVLPLMRAPPSPRLIGLLLVAVVALRLGFANLVLDRASRGDSQSYLTLAASLNAGTGLSIVEPFLGITTRALFPPLYPVLLAGWSTAFGLSTPSLLALGTLIDLATAAIMLLLAIRLGNAAAGRGAAWLYLIWPSVLFSAPLAQKESLCAFLILTMGTAWVSDDGPSMTRVGVIGVAAGLLALTQPGEAPLAALFGLVLIRRIGLAAVLRIGVPAAGIACAILSPWWIRNWLVFGAFVPLTTSSGVSLWIGNNPGATGNWMAPPASLRGLPEIEYGRQASGIARAWIETHPLQFSRLTFAKLARSCSIGHFGLIRLYAMHPAPTAWMAATLFPLAQGTHLAMLGGAAVATRLRADRALATVLLLLVACGIQLALFGVWFEFGERHREFATPFLLLLICTGFSRSAQVAQSTDLGGANAGLKDNTSMLPQSEAQDRSGQR